MSSAGGRDETIDLRGRPLTEEDFREAVDIIKEWPSQSPPPTMWMHWDDYLYFCKELNLPKLSETESREKKELPPSGNLIRKRAEW